MGEITEGTRRHYIGADADKDTIPAGGKAFGDSYHANDKGKQYYWNGAAWKTGLGYEYVPRAVTGWDFEHGVLTIDGNYHVNGLDCSAIVPAGAVAIHFSIYLRDDAASSEMILRANATTKSANNVYIKVPVANISQFGDGILFCDSDRLVDYLVTNGTDALGIKIVGWFI